MNYAQKRREINDTWWTLDHLSKLNRKNITEQDITDATAKLFTLIIEKKPCPLLKRTWLHMGYSEQPIIPTKTIHVIDLEIEINGITTQSNNKNKIVLAPTFDQENMYLVNLGVRNDELPSSLPYTTKENFRLSKFVDSCGLFIKGEYIKRSSVIRFLRNRRGGAHGHDWELDPKDEKSFPLLAESYDPTLIPSQNGRENYFQLGINGLNLIEMYVQNTIYDLINSPDVQKIMKARPSEDA